MASKKVFIETSVFIRFLTKDDETKYQDCVRLFELVENGRVRPYISNIVIMEILFILTRHYRFSKKEVLDAIGKILQLRNLTLHEKTNTELAIKLFDKHNIKFGDCLISTQIKPGVVLATYDSDFSKLKKCKIKTPAEIVTAH